MADVKKAVAAAKPIAKPVAKPVVAPKAEAKAEVKAEAKTPAKKVAEKAPAKKTEAKKVETKKAPEKKASAKPAAKKTTAEKKEVVAAINIQFAGKEYKTEDFVNIAKDVWKYDLGKKVADFKAVELYVKPEESKVYYVINGDVTGYFDI